MKCQIFFPGKIRKKCHQLSSAEFALSVLSANNLVKINLNSA